jgi:hypothetical protein
MPYLVATDSGLLLVSDAGRFSRLSDQPFRHVVPGADDGEAVALDDTGQLWDVDEDGAAAFADLGATLPGVTPGCVLVDGEEVWVGTLPAGVYRRDGDTFAELDGFARAPGRDRWTTPAGGRPSVRSLDIDDDNTLWANVHVGGILRSSDMGASWQPTIDQGVDVHQVFAVPGKPGSVVAACGAGGLASTDDGGQTWTMSTTGLASTYCRAVAVAGDTVLLSAQDGPGGGGTTLYRRPLDAPDAPFKPCAGGLPDGLPGSIDTFCVTSWDEDAAVVLPNGELYVSRDAGYAWRRLVGSLGQARAVAII